MIPRARWLTRSAAPWAAVAIVLSLWACGAAGAGGPYYVPNEYIIHVLPGTQFAEVEQAVAKMGGTLVQTLAVRDAYLIRMDGIVRRPAVPVRRAGSVGRWVISRIQPNLVKRACAIPNDDLWDKLWGMRLINAPAAWDVEKGQDTVIVAVNDSGVAKHPELVGRLIAGYDFIENDNDPSNDVYGHGTHVAGTIAAQGNNGDGVVGVCWDGVKILPIRVLDDQGSGTTAGAVAGLDFAMAHGAQVVNMSYGSPAGFEDPAEQMKLSELAAAGIILCAAAGNDASAVGSPASFAECIAVSAVGPSEAPAAYSNYGPEIDIAAPGGDSERGGDDALIWSTVVLDLAKQTYGYDGWEGTSMACPHVSGAAALLLGAGVPAGDVRARLENSARRPRSGSLDRLRYGFGILDIYAALANASMRIVKPEKGSVVATTNPEFKIALKGVDTSTIRVYVDYADLNDDGVPDNPSAETPVIDSTNVNYFVNASQTTITFTWSDVSSQTMAPGKHFVYVSGMATVGGGVVADWGTFTLASKVIPAGIHLFSFPYKLDTRAVFPQDLLIGSDFSWDNPNRSVLKRWITSMSQYVTYLPGNLSDLTWVNPVAGSIPTGGGYYVDLFTQERVYSFPAGSGFWLLLPQPVMMNEAYGALDSLATFDKSKGYTIPLYAGWNMIGNPCAHSVRWAAALFTYQGETKTLVDADRAGWVKPYLFRYRTSPVAGYDAISSRDMLEPYTGYWLRALVGGTDPSQSLTLTVLP